ncbi:MAG: protein kinase, partial [Planctomycetaceae bacterium]|nr:protein kinase [Planctomycetaceae bacterium]
MNRAEEDRADDDRAEEEAFAVAGFSPDDRLSTVIVRWGIQIAEALAFAHKRRVLHCDVKPGNVLLMNNLRARLLDFNLAVSADSPLVLQGGTLPYMASEQLAMLINALGQEQPDDRTVVTCSTATDVFGTCATLWQLATGTPPFGDAIDLKSRGLAARLLMERQRFGVSAEQLEAIRSVLPDGVVQVLLKGLTFDPCDRISTASELAGLLKEQLPQCPVRAAHENSALWSRGGLAAMTCLLVVSFAFVMTALSSGPQSERNLSSTGDRTTNTDPAVRRTAEAHLMASQGRFEEALEVLAGLSSKSPLDRVLELYCRTCTVPKLVLSGLDDSANVPPPPESYTSAETWETWARLAAEWQSISASEAVLSNTELGNCCRWNLGVIQLELLNLDAAAEAFASCDCRYGSPEQSEFAQHFVDWQRGRMAGLPPDPDRLRRMIDLIPQTSSRGMSLTVICLLCDLTEVADDATHVISSSEVFQLLNTMSGRFAEPGALNLIKNAR